MSGRQGVILVSWSSSSTEFLSLTTLARLDLTAALEQHRVDALPRHAVRRVAVEKRLIVARLGQQHAVSVEDVHEDCLRAAVVKLEDVEERLEAREVGEAARRGRGKV